MRALKILDAGGVGRFSSFRWPLPAGGEPGAWVEASAEAHACVRGVHACAPEHLPTWLGPELYVIELGGPVVRAESKLVASRGRLLFRVEAWDAACVSAYVTASALQGRDAAAAILRNEGDDVLADHLIACTSLADLGDAIADADPRSDRGRLTTRYLRDALTFAASAPISSVYCAAHAGLDPAGFAAARAFQARWLADTLRLDEALAT